MIVNLLVQGRAELRLGEKPAAIVIAEQGEQTMPTTSSSLTDAVIAALAKVHLGDRRHMELLLTAFLAGGHVLLEDIPGVGKTTLARALAQICHGSFRRVQCTPDLMPADITGISIYDERDRRFIFHPGPIFSDILLADELNRTPPRTQSALLEALEDRQVSVDGEARALPAMFFCIATQNPHDQVGTYPLPDSQRDRFLLCFGLGYPERRFELRLLDHDGAAGALANTEPLLDAQTVATLRSQVRTVSLHEDVRNYLLDIVHATRTHPGTAVGASPRAALGLQRASQALALIRGRGFVTPADIQDLAEAALAHRIHTRHDDARSIVRGILSEVAVPR